MANVRSYLDSLGKQLSPEAQQLLEAMESKQMVSFNNKQQICNLFFIEL